MLTLSEFLSLPYQDKFDLIFNKGNFIEAKTEENNQVILYAVDQFFVKLYFDPNVNKIVKISGFTSVGS